MHNRVRLCGRLHSGPAAGRCICFFLGPEEAWGMCMAVVKGNIMVNHVKSLWLIRCESWWEQLSIEIHLQWDLPYRQDYTLCCMCADRLSLYYMNTSLYVPPVLWPHCNRLAAWHSFVSVRYQHLSKIPNYAKDSFLITVVLEHLCLAASETQVISRASGISKMKLRAK